MLIGTSDDITPPVDGSDPAVAGALEAFISASDPDADVPSAAVEATGVLVTDVGALIRLGNVLGAACQLTDGDADLDDSTVEALNTNLATVLERLGGIVRHDLFAELEAVLAPLKNAPVSQASLHCQYGQATAWLAGAQASFQMARTTASSSTPTHERDETPGTGTYL